MTTSLAKLVGIGMVWTSYSTLLMKLTGVVYTVLMLSQLSLYEYGVVQLLFTIPAFLAIINLPGIDQVVISDGGVAKGDNDPQTLRELLDSYLVARFLLGLASFLFLFLAAPIVADFYNEAIANAIRIISFTFLLSPLRSLFVLTFKVSLRYGAHAAMVSVEEVGKVLVLATGFFVFDAGILAPAFAYIGGEIIMLLVLLVPVLHARSELFAGTTRRVSLAPVWDVVKNHGKWAMLMTYTNTLGQQLRLWLIKFFISTQAVAIYSVAFKLYQMTSKLVPFSKVIQPIVPQLMATRGRLYRMVNKTVKYQLLSNAAIAVVALVFVPIVIQGFFPQYQPSILLYLVMLTALLPLSLTTGLQPMFYAAKAQRSLFVATMTRVGLMLVLAPILMLTVGVVGVAIELVITRLFYAANRYLAIKRLFPDFSIQLKEMLYFDETDQWLLKRMRKKVGL